MTTVVTRKRRPEPEQVYDPPGAREAREGQDRAPLLANGLPPVYRRSVEGLRIDLLEVLAWAIYCLETCDAHELTEFSKELKQVREREWGIRLWSGAKDPERFIEHVTAMAEDFTSRPVRYRNRKHQPNPAA